MKRIFFPALFVFSFCLLSSCNNSTQKPVANADTSLNVSGDTSSTAVPDMHNSAISLDWDGKYTGTLPCADCEGIETELILNKDKTYSLKTKYVGKNDKGREEKGSFSWNEAGNTVILAGIKDRPNQYFVGENKVMQLDMNGNKITGPMADKYILVKQRDSNTYR